MNIRLAQKDDIQFIAKIHIDNWKKIYEGIFPAEYLSNLTYSSDEKEWLKYLQQENAFIYIALTGENKICGFAACKMDIETPGSGKLYAIHISEKDRGCGIGKQLIKTVANHFLTRNINSMTLWAVEENEKAIAIYKHLGAKPHKYETRYFDWVPVKQIGFIWRDISCLCQKKA